MCIIYVAIIHWYTWPLNQCFFVSMLYYDCQMTVLNITIGLQSHHKFDIVDIIRLPNHNDDDDDHHHDHDMCFFIYTCIHHGYTWCIRLDLPATYQPMMYYISWYVTLRHKTMVVLRVNTPSYWIVPMYAMVFSCVDRWYSVFVGLLTHTNILWWG